MVTVRKDEDTMEVFYHDPSSGMMWKSFFPRGYKDKNSPKLLRPEPPAESLNEQIDMDLGSGEINNAIGLGIELSGQPSIWTEVLDVLDAHRKEYSRKMIRTFLDNLGVSDPNLIFNELGKSPEDTGLSFEDLQTLKKKARKIRVKRFFGL
ncbi:hypothetical protein AB2B38_006825 [Balneola sp. MJW-20]|uniref:hypothetical protein n=1 Tax=Gracilimonas aurantiaca TaxID=3234185 RepID=UPI00390BB6B7